MSTEKQLENIGKVVKEVKVLKSGVKVTFEDGDSVLLDVNSYVNGERLYKGKELSYGKVETLKRAEDDAKYYSYVLKLVASRPYSSKKLIDKLVNVKEASYKKAIEVVDKLKEQGLINDELYIRTCFEDFINKGYSKEFVIRKLEEEGYSKDVVENIFVEYGFTSKEDEIVSSLFQKYSNKSFRSCKDHVFSSLYKRGYDANRCNELINSYIENNEDFKNAIKDNEEELLFNDMKKLVERYRIKGLDRKEIKNKVISKLMSHKYDFDKIIEMYERKEDELY